MPTNVLRAGISSAILSVLGVVLSGPLAVVLVQATHPQPEWRGAEVYAQHFHPIQMVPYLGGIVLVGALITLVSCVRALADEHHRVQMSMAQVFTAAFAMLIFLNYVLQSTFLPDLARNYVPANAPIIAAFSMANPTSLAWGIEMWGWGFLGVATWLVAPPFHGSALERATSATFVANGVMSVIGALITVASPGWVLSPMGLVVFGAWNLLLLAMAVLTWMSFQKRLGGEVPLAHPA